MTENECLKRMKAPGDKKPGKWLSGVVQILVTSSCDKACFNCTQGSNLTSLLWDGKVWAMTVKQFRTACRTLKDYFGVVGMFGGNPVMNSEFPELCAVMREEIPFERRGLWCNNPVTVANAKIMRETFNPHVSNLNVHMDAKAYEMFKSGWPESMPFGLDKDSRHSPPWVAMKDLDALPVFDKNHKVIDTADNTEEHRLNLIADCDINQNWSPAIGVFRGQLRAWFCEIAMAQSIRHQNDPNYSDTGLVVDPTADIQWWELAMNNYREQVRKHCHDCGVPLRGYGELAMSKNGKEQVSETHQSVFKTKRLGRTVELVTERVQLGVPLRKSTDYMGNAK